MSAIRATIGGMSILDWYQEGDNGGGTRAFWEIGTSIGMPNCDGTRWAGMDQGVAYYQNIGTVTPGRGLCAENACGRTERLRNADRKSRDGESVFRRQRCQCGRWGDAGHHLPRRLTVSCLPPRTWKRSAQGNSFSMPRCPRALRPPVRPFGFISRRRRDGPTLTMRGWRKNWEPIAHGILPRHEATVGVSTTTGVLSWNTGVNVNNDYQTDTSIVAHRVYVGVDRNAVIIGRLVGCKRDLSRPVGGRYPIV